MIANSPKISNGLSLLNMETILQGDLNLDYRRTQSFNRHRFVKDLKDSNFGQLVTEITRTASKTCLDNIWTIRPEFNELQTSDVRTYIYISDHLPVLAAVRGTNIVLLTKGSNIEKLYLP